MANKNVFKSSRYVAPTPTDTINNAGGAAYSLNDKESLAQMVMTGVFNNSFYVSAENQIDNVKALLDKLGPEEATFIAKLAIHARTNGFMKDTPAFLVAWLSKNSPEYFKIAFERVIDNGKMLRNFVQIMRSGAVGRKSLGTSPKNMVKQWISNASVRQLIQASVGKDPSLADILKMVHPTPNSIPQNILFKWFLGMDLSVEESLQLPREIKHLIAFRKGRVSDVPPVPFELLTSCNLTKENWATIATNGGWHMTRMNLNTFGRNGLFDSRDIVTMIADKLSNAQEIAKAKVFPYQIFTTWKFADSLPKEIVRALEYALEYSLQTVPSFNGKKVHIFVDVSGSMRSPITGTRSGATSVIRCNDVAGLIASSFLRANPDNTSVVMFDTEIHKAKLKAASSVMENTNIISSFGGGGTSCQLPLQKLVREKAEGDLIIYISDNESWLNTGWNRRVLSSQTQTQQAWTEYKKINPKAKMVCIDLVPNTTTQALSDSSVLNIGGFSDAVYDVIDAFVNMPADKNYWVNAINNAVQLNK